MTGLIRPDLLSRFSEFIAAHTALYFPPGRWSDLELKAASAAGEFGFADTESFIRWMTSAAVSRAQIETLASHLTVSETYFWREPEIFHALMDQILPPLVRSRKEYGKLIRIWSAGCSTGEEPYSIAIALRQIIPHPDEWNITILATDINPRSLRKAQKGLYTQWSFRNAPDWLRKKFFLQRRDGLMEILPDIKKMVAFSYLNLAEDVYPSAINNTSAIDIIFCRNVLMYFEPRHADRAIQGFIRSLSTGGWLIVSGSEFSLQISRPLFLVRLPKTMAYRKEPPDTGHETEFHLPDLDLHQEPPQPAPDISVAGKQTEQPSGFDASLRTSKIAYPTPPQTFPEKDPNPVFCEETKPKAQEAENDAMPQPTTDLIRSLADTGNLSAALALCNQAITRNRLDPGLHFLHAVILQEQNNEGEAILSLRRTLYLDPNHALAHFTLGNLMMRRGDKAYAKKCFANVLELIGGCRQDDILPESEGLTAGRLKEIIQASIHIGARS